MAGKVIKRMLTIRLLRTGKKNQPSYKIVVADKKNPPKGGKFVEEVGFFNPKTKERIFKKERITYWLGVGAQASDTIHNMLVNEKIINEPKRKIIFTKKPAVVETMADKKVAVVEEVKPVAKVAAASPVAEGPESIEGPVEEPVAEPVVAASPESIAASPELVEGKEEPVVAESPVAEGSEPAEEAPKE
jgi:small subunit ribosomal protein S16